MNKTVKVKVNEKNFNGIELEAISKAHNSFFYANMSDDIGATYREEAAALELLKQTIANVSRFFPSFYKDEEDTIELYIAMTEEEEEQQREHERIGFLTDLKPNCAVMLFSNDTVKIDIAKEYITTHNDYIMEEEYAGYITIRRI